MVVKTDSERVRTSRTHGARVSRVVGRSVDSQPTCNARSRRYDVDARALRPAGASRAAGQRDASVGGPPRHALDVPRPQRPSHNRSRSTTISTSATTRSASVLQVRRGLRRATHQNTFAIAVAGRGFDARISTEYAVPLPDSACVYCGNCIGVCPTGALMFEPRARAARVRRLGCVAQTTDRHDLPVLRRRLHAHAARPGRPDRQGHLAGRERRDARPPVRQGPVRVRARPELSRRQRLQPSISRRIRTAGPKRVCASPIRWKPVRS